MNDASICHYTWSKLSLLRARLGQGGLWGWARPVLVLVLGLGVTGD
jgi:hypothetical protein